MSGYAKRYRDDPLYKRIKSAFGYRHFHLYNLVPETAPIKTITEIKGKLQEFTINGVCRVVGKQSIRIRGLKRAINKYELA